MSTLGLALFNLLVNGGVSLAFAVAVVAAARRVRGIGEGRFVLLLLCAPFAKAAYEVVRGIPASSFFWAKLAGAHQDLGTFQLGVGIRAPAVPVLHLSLGALANGRTYAQSIADLAATGLSRHVASWVPPALGLALGALVVGRSLVWAVGAALAARRERSVVGEARPFAVRSLRFRSVRVVVAEVQSAIPFAGGLFRPWICIPRSTFEALSVEERDAVIAHELAHLRYFDGPLLVAVDLLGQAFSFVPGSRGLVRAIHAQVEMAADARAVRDVAATVLASALVRVAESACAKQDAHEAPCLALLPRGGLLSQRVTLLLSSNPATRWRLIMRVATVLVLAAGVMRATTFGNP